MYRVEDGQGAEWQRVLTTVYRSWSSSWRGQSIMWWDLIAWPRYAILDCYIVTSKCILLIRIKKPFLDFWSTFLSIAYGSFVATFMLIGWVGGCVCVHLQGMRVRMAPGQHDKVDMYTHTCAKSCIQQLSHSCEVKPRVDKILKSKITSKILGWSIASI